MINYLTWEELSLMQPPTPPPLSGKKKKNALAALEAWCSGVLDQGEGLEERLKLDLSTPTLTQTLSLFGG